MDLRKIIVQAGIVTYLVLTLCALLFTLFRFTPLPISVVGYFYGMMAPYQGFSPYNADLIAEGKTADGGWEQIDLEYYFPVSTGERTYRLYMQTARNRGPEVAAAAYEELRRLIQEKEATRGNVYDEILLTFEVWPASAEGFDALRTPERTRQYDPLALQHEEF